MKNLFLMMQRYYDATIWGKFFNETLKLLSEMVTLYKGSFYFSITSPYCAILGPY